MQRIEISGYSVAIHGRHVHITDAIRDYIFEKLAKIERFSHHLIEVVITLDVQKLDHKVDVVLKFDHFKVKVHAVSENMYASIDKAMDRLQAQVRKYKERVTAHQAKGLKATEMNVAVYKSDEERINEAIERENQEEEAKRYRIHEVMRREKQPLKTLTAGEALVKMELSQDHFLIYRSEEDRKLKVLYRMPDGNFGLVEPE